MLQEWKFEFWTINAAVIEFIPRQWKRIIQVQYGMLVVQKHLERSLNDLTGNN